MLPGRFNLIPLVQYFGQANVQPADKGQQALPVGFGLLVDQSQRLTINAGRLVQIALLGIQLGQVPHRNQGDQHITGRLANDAGFLKGARGFNHMAAPTMSCAQALHNDASQEQIIDRQVLEGLVKKGNRGRHIALKIGHGGPQRGHFTQNIGAVGRRQVEPTGFKPFLGCLQVGFDGL